MDSFWTQFLVGVAVFWTVLIVLGWRRFRSLNRPLRHLTSGAWQRYLDENLRLLENERSPRLRNNLRYNRANCLYRMGDLDGAIDELDRIERAVLDPLLESVYYALYAQSLLLLRRDLESVDRYFEKSNRLRAMPSRPLYLAYLRLLQGERASGLRLLEEFEAHKHDKPGRGFGFHTRLRRDELFSRLEIDFFLGASFLILGEHDRARRHLTSAIDAPYQNIYSDRSQRLLSGLGSPLPFAGLTADRG
ncbi:MAG: hypothetical protein KC609_19570 [Myxococcales bacterium]|nr:hypothetical protein [Myxococcales bacterium]